MAITVTSTTLTTGKDLNAVPRRDISTQAQSPKRGGEVDLRTFGITARLVSQSATQLMKLHPERGTTCQRRTSASRNTGRQRGAGVALMGPYYERGNGEWARPTFEDAKI